MRNLIRFSFWTIWFSLFVLEAKGYAQSLPVQPVIVGVKEAPPFVIKNKDGTWDGLSIDLLQEISKEMKFTYQIKELPLEQLLSGVQTGELVMAIAAITITPEREEVVDFSSPYFAAGYGIMTIPYRQYVYSALIWVFLCVLSFIFFFALLYWLAERKVNPDIGEKFFPGIFHAMYFILYTAVTVGYGDITKTPNGKKVNAVTMLLSTVLLSVLTGYVVSVFQQKDITNKFEDGRLVKRSIATVNGSSGERWLRHEGIDPWTFSNLEDAISMLRDGKVDGVFYDAPVLQALNRTHAYSDLLVLDKTFGSQFYGIVVPEHYHKEPLNKAVEKVINSKWWSERVYMRTER